MSSAVMELCRCAGDIAAPRIDEDFADCGLMYGFIKRAKQASQVVAYILEDIEQGYTEQTFIDFAVLEESPRSMKEDLKVAREEHLDAKAMVNQCEVAQTLTSTSLAAALYSRGHSITEEEFSRIVCFNMGTR